MDVIHHFFSIMSLSKKSKHVVCPSSLPQAPIKHLMHNKCRSWQPFKGTVPDCTRVQLENEWASVTSGDRKPKQQNASQPLCETAAHGSHCILNSKELLTCHWFLLHVSKKSILIVFLLYIYHCYCTLWLFSNNSVWIELCLYSFY